MTDEEMQRTMEFIVEQDARISAKLEALLQSQAESKKEADQEKKEAGERWARADERWAKADERWARTEESIRALLAVAELHERDIISLGETTRATDERLNVLINVVERNISEGRNGKP